MSRFYPKRSYTIGEGGVGADKEGQGGRHRRLLPAHVCAHNPLQDGLAQIRAAGFNVGQYAARKGSAKTCDQLRIIMRVQMDVVCSGKLRKYVRTTYVRA